MSDWLTENAAAVQAIAAAIQAIAGVAALVATGFLVWFTRRYVKLTGDLVAATQSNLILQRERQEAEHRALEAERLRARRETAVLAYTLAQTVDRLPDGLSIEAIRQVVWDPDTVQRLVEAAHRIGPEASSLALRAQSALIQLDRYVDLLEKARNYRIGDAAPIAVAESDWVDSLGQAKQGLTALRDLDPSRGEHHRGPKWELR
jgi:hypothetical protein